MWAAKERIKSWKGKITVKKRRRKNCCTESNHRERIGKEEEKWKVRRVEKRRSANYWGRDESSAWKGDQASRRNKTAWRKNSENYDENGWCHLGWQRQKVANWSWTRLHKTVFTERWTSTQVGSAC